MPIAVVAIVLLVQRVRLPAFLALMATVVVYGIAADMTFQSVGKAFGLGFTAALEQAACWWWPARSSGAVLLRTPLGTGTSAAAGALAGLGASAAGGLALLQPAGQDAPRRALALALTLLAVGRARGALAAGGRRGVGDEGRHPHHVMIAVPIAVVAAALGWWHVARLEPSSTVPGKLDLGVALHRIPDRVADRAVGRPDAERAAGQGRRARILYRHLQAADPDGDRHHLAVVLAPAAGSRRRWSAVPGRRCCSRSARRAASAACSTRPAWRNSWPNTHCTRATAC